MEHQLTTAEPSMSAMRSRGETVVDTYASIVWKGYIYTGLTVVGLVSTIGIHRATVLAATDIWEC